MHVTYATQRHKQIMTSLMTRLISHFCDLRSAICDLRSAISYLLSFSVFSAANCVLRSAISSLERSDKIKEKTKYKPTR